MLKLPKDPLSSIHVSKNGVKTALLKSQNGLSVIGSIFSFGAEDSPQSGQTFLTLQAKLLDSLGSPEKMFRHGITPHISVQRQTSTILLSFLPESEKIANSVLDQVFGSAKPSSHSLGQARRILSDQEIVGNLTSDVLFEGAACAASYSEPRHHVGVYSSSPSITGGHLEANDAILSGLKSSAILFGSSDQEANLTSLAASFDGYKPRKAQESKFSSGICARKPSNVAFHGSVLQKNQTMELAVLSFPAVSTDSDDFLAYKVIQKIFGGGSEFSSDGLGIGLNSLLYTNVMTYGCEFIKCLFFPYAKNGLLSFGFKADSDSFRVVSRKLASCVRKALEIKDSQFNSAKEQAIFEILKSIDDSRSRYSEFAAQNFFWGEAKQISSIVEAIRAVPKEHVVKCLQQTFAKDPSVGIIGESSPNILKESWKLNK